MYFTAVVVGDEYYWRSSGWGKSFPVQPTHHRVVTLTSLHLSHRYQAPCYLWKPSDTLNSWKKQKKFRKWTELRPAGMVFLVARKLFTDAVCGPAQATTCATAHSFCSQILPGALNQGFLFMFLLYLLEVTLCFSFMWRQNKYKATQ